MKNYIVNERYIVEEMDVDIDLDNSIFGYCACEDCYVLVCNYDYTDVRFVGWPYDPWEEIVSCALMIDIRMGL